MKLSARSLNVKQFYLTHLLDPIRMNLGAMAMKGYSAFLKVPKLEPHHYMVSFHIQDTVPISQYMQ